MNEKSIVQKYKAVQVELSQLSGEVLCALTEKQNGGGYIYPNAYGGWVQRYNKIVQKVNGLMGTSLPERQVLESDLSSSRKTVRPESVKAFALSIQKLEQAVAKEIHAEESKAASIPGHQMRRCFKTGTRGCPRNPPEQKSQVFVAMPFSDEYKDSYEFGVKIVLEQLGMMPYKADENINNKDVMCKICEKIQCCGKVIANISGRNPNVMLEVGIAYGLGKEVFLIKDEKSEVISDLGCVEYIEYSHAADLQRKLYNALRSSKP